MSLRFLCVVGLLFALQGTALARDFYLAGAGGVSSADNLALVAQENFTFDDGSALAISGGYDLGWLRLELELAHSQNDVDSFQVAGVSSDGRGEVTVTSLVFNACLEYEITPFLTPWIGLGVGSSVVEFDNVGSQLTGVVLNDSDAGGVAQFQLGAAVRFTEHWLGTFSYEISSIPITFTEISSGQSREVDFDRELMLMGLRYEF